MTEIEQWEKDLGEAIVEAAEGALVTKFLVIAETINGETGEPQLEWFASSAMAVWDKIGFLRYCASHYDNQHRDEDR
jgi:hypothetical protein